MKTHPVTSRFFYGYVIVIVAFMLQAVGWGVFNSMGVFFKPFMDEFAWSRALISSAFSLAMLVCGMSSILQGRLSDRFGPRVVMAVGGTILGIGYLLMSRVSHFWHVYLYCTIIIGFGISGTDVVMLSTTSRWFVKFRGLVTGIAKVGTGVGMLVMPLLLNWFIHHYGWRVTFFSLGILSLVIYICLAQLLVRDPGKMGLLPDNEKRVSPAPDPEPEKGVNSEQAVRTMSFWTICLAYILALFCLATMLLHVVPHVIDMGFSSTNGASILSTVGAVSIMGRFVMGGMADRIGTKPVLVICFICLSMGLFWLQIADRFWMMVVFACLHGFAHGGFFAIVAPTIAEYFGTRSHGELFGIVTFASTFGAAAGPVLAGFVFDASGSYQMVFRILAGVSVAGLGCAISLKRS
ncbi:MAG: MFS transporter [Desulfobacterales bacterium]|nr:MFS transporter [Desulfobacterales bacterium]MDX2511515.1 MFS transporter [Desulfobacterales bacterium]